MNLGFIVKARFIIKIDIDVRTEAFYLDRDEMEKNKKYNKMRNLLKSLALVS